MTSDTVECYNCGRANPAWAQVCRSCGVPMRPGAAVSRSSGPIPTDRDSLISIGATLAAIAGAIVLGLVLSGIIPDAPPLAEVVETPEPSLNAVPSGSAAPSGGASAAPELLGTITFGTGVNQAEEVLNQTDTFGPGSGFCHSLQLTKRFRVRRIQQEVLRVEEDGTLTEVQQRRGSNLNVDPQSRIGGWCAPGGADALLANWGAGTFIMRDYRNPQTPELLGEAQFTLTE
jgi:hypothetical protein